MCTAGFTAIAVSFAVYTADRLVVLRTGAPRTLPFTADITLFTVVIGAALVCAGAWAFLIAFDFNVSALSLTGVAVSFSVFPTDRTVDHRTDALGTSVISADVSPRAVLIGLTLTSGSSTGALSITLDFDMGALGFTGVAVGFAVFPADRLVDHRTGAD